MSLYQRGKSWYYDFQYRGQRYAGSIGQVSKTVAKEVFAYLPIRSGTILSGAKEAGQE